VGWAGGGKRRQGGCEGDGGGQAWKAVAGWERWRLGEYMGDGGGLERGRGEWGRRWSGG